MKPSYNRHELIINRIGWALVIVGAILGLAGIAIGG